MSHRRILTSLAGLAAAALAVPALATAAPAPAPADSSVSTAATRAAYTGSPQDEAATKAFYDAVMKSVAAKRAKAAKAGQTLDAVTVTYAVDAPTFRSQINSSTQIWNSSVANVQLVEGSNYDFYYTEGNDPRGSYASTNGHGSGYIFLDYAQSQQYDSLRITAHETGHVLGLPDHYSGPCSELMSGGGPGPSCTNPNPDANERARVNQLWANGKTSLPDAAFHVAR
ncbi:snapalysin [Kribbella sandramycini]|uniref:Extracellular small neutral protease n=1 Tax=Kribbella sandramycini TaxID=60450 RepID=A0A7Y4P265_9ACTN|nr:snapalysin [Kribbella sandramycini]MBB6566528.1 snapalysin [Kribbella sandramycini]NOL42815.1 snapalysin [Kribbella sandramycini]